MLELVLNDWVTETNETLCASNSSISLAKSASERVPHDARAEKTACLTA
jgi:hypothetical protein